MFSLKSPQRVAFNLAFVFLFGVAGYVGVWLSPLGASEQGNSFTTVSAASFTPTLAPEAIAAGFGAKLATSTVIATNQPLPTQLAGTTVGVNGVLAPLFFVSPNQINYLIPAGTATGNASVIVTSGDGSISTGTVQIRSAAPTIFTLSSNGSGIPTATLLRVTDNGTQTSEPISQFDSGTGIFRPSPINLCPSGDRVFLILFLTGVRHAVVDTVRVLIGGQSLFPVYSGPAPGFVGLDQINAEIPRSLIGSGLIKLSVAVSGAALSNEAEVEIGAPCGSSLPQVTSLSTTTLLAGQELTITGTNFSATMAENSVRIIGDETQPEAQILEASPTRLRVLIPFGASSGKISVRTPQGEGSTVNPVTMRTSVSGFVQDTRRQPIRDVTVRMTGTNLSAQTNAEGAFILPDATPSLAATIEIDGTTVPGDLPYPKQQFKMRVRANRDNQVNGYIELKQATGPSLAVGPGFTTGQSLVTYAEWPANAAAPAAPESQIQTGQVILDVPNNATVRFPGGATSGSLTLTVLESGRTPGTLPAGQFSPVIAQITPFGAMITPGAKLTFPNPDGYAPNAVLKLYRYDQTQNSPTLGSFVEAGAATVSADGQRIESAPNAVTEASYYFASGTRPMVTLIGRVVENNLNRTPVRRSLVNARGQGIFTDGNGGFVIRNVPINASSAFAAQLSGEVVVEAGVGEVVIADDRIGIEADFMRPSTRVDRSQHEDVPPVVTGPTVSPDLVLSAATANRPPNIFAPANITMNAGTTREVAFFASDPDAGQTVQVTVSGPNFATVIKGSSDSFILRLTPGTNDGGNYVLALTASDGQGGTNTQNISLRVNGVGVTADDQVVIVDKNTAKAIMLSGSDPLGRPLTFVIVSQPSRGTLSGTPPNVTYTPMTNYIGLDSFTFKVRAGQAESNEATVTIRVQGVNSAPVLTVPGNLSVNGGETLKFTVAASDPDAGQTLKFEVLGKPDGATIIENPNSLQFSWTPADLQIRSYEVTFKVTDNGTLPLSDTKQVTITTTAKWAKTSGPEGGAITSFTSANGALYAGTSGGGVYRSSDNGQSWVAVNTGLTGSALAVNALQPVGSSLFAGTFDGVYRTSDNGQSWVAVNTGLPGSAVRVNALQAVGSSLFAGTENSGVYRTNDDGQSWVAVNTGLTGSALKVRALHTIGGNLFAGTYDGVYRTSDNGQSWVAVNTGLPGSAVRVNALQAVGSSLFAGTENSGVYRTNDNGQSWVAVNTGLTGSALKVRALQAVGSSLFAGTYDGVYRTSDNGQSWRAVNTGLTGNGALIVDALQSVGSSLFAGTVGGVYRTSDNGQSWTPTRTGISASTVGALLSTPNGLFAGNIGGVHRSIDSGQSWMSINQGLLNQFVIALHADGGSLFAGTQDGVYRTIDNGQSWIAANTGLRYHALALQAVGSRLFAGTSNGVYRTSNNGQSWGAVNNGLTAVLDATALQAVGSSLFAGTPGSGVYRTNDNGQSWVPVNTGLPPGNALYVLALQSVGNSVFAGTLGGVYMTSDDGQSWVAANVGLPGGANHVNVMQSVGDSLFAGTKGGGVYRTSNNGQNWVAVNTGLTGSAFMVLALQSVGSTLFAGTEGGVYRTSDYGQSWVAVNVYTGIQPFVRALQSFGSSLFAGTFFGVYRTSDNGQSWVAVNNGLMGDALRIRVLYVFGSSLFAGTDSGGLYRTSDNGQSWVAVNTGLPAFVRALQAVGNSLFAGTQGGGVYRTSDNGQSWVAVNIGLTTGNALTVRVLQAVGSNLLAGTDGGGVYRTSDNGQNWVAVNTGLPGNALYVRAMQMIGNNLFAGTYGGGVYRTSDNGQSWVAVNTGLAGDGLSVLALQAVGSNLFAGTQTGGVYRTSDNGQSWVRFDSNLISRYIGSMASDGIRLFAGTGGDGVSVRADTVQAWSESNPNLTNRFANSITISGNSLFAGTLGGGVFRSDNQGRSWATVNAGLPPSANIQSVMANGATLWTAAFGDGIYRSTNQGASWTAVNTGLNNKFVNQLFTSGTTLYTGTEGGVYRSLDGGDNWTPISTGIGTVPVDSFAAFGGTVYAGTDGNGVFRLNSDGVSWTRKSSGLTSTQVRSLGVNGNVLYAGTIGGGICLSRDGGESWTAVNNQIPPNLNVFAFAVSRGKVYAGSVYGVFVTENEGQSWTQINAGLLNTFVTGLAVSGEQLFASTASGGVFVSRIP